MKLRTIFILAIDYEFEMKTIHNLREKINGAWNK